MDLFIYGTVREVWADQEDGTAEIGLAFLKHQAPHSRGFLFGGMRVSYFSNEIITFSFFS